MREIAELHRLRDNVARRLRNGDVIGAWNALESLADAAQRPEAPLDEVQGCLAECLEVICAWSNTVGDHATFPRTVADISTLAAAASGVAAARAFLPLAWQPLRPSLIAQVLEQHRFGLESAACHKLAESTAAPGVIQDAALRLLVELYEPCTVRDIVAAAYRKVRARARTRGRRQFVRARRSTPVDDVRHLLVHTPDVEVATTARRLDELALGLLAPDLHSVYVLRREGLLPTEIAERLGISPATERRRWLEACRRLRREIAPARRS